MRVFSVNVPGGFDTLEIAPIFPVRRGVYERAECVQDVPKSMRKTMSYMLYGHLPGRGCFSIGTFDTEEEAIEIAEYLGGTPGWTKTK